MNHLPSLRDELDAWAAAGRTATFWWRDDDAVAHTAQLAPLLDLAARHAVPVALAVVPRKLERTLAGALAGARGCTVVQHGFAHANHAPAGTKSIELGARPAADVLEELALGAATLRDAFGSAFAPVLVPPWNRIDAALVAQLAGLGFRGLSTFAPRAARRPATHLVQCNTHVDPIAWRKGRRFVGHDVAEAAVIAHLQARREAAVDPDEPTGLLTHHLVFGADAWRFADALLHCTRDHPAARWIAVDEAFGLTSGRPA